MSTGILAVGALLLGLGLAYLIWGRRKNEGASDLIKQLDLLQQRIIDREEGTTKLVREMKSDLLDRLESGQERLDKSTQSMHDQVRQFTSSITKMDEGLRNVHRTVSDSVEKFASFQDIFKTPKLRGQWGESNLKYLLGQTYPPDRVLEQYHFSSGTEAVDFALVLPNDFILPIDSKFPSDIFSAYAEESDLVEKNKKKQLFVTSVKKEIDSISSKYIRPNEHTTDHALMFVPAEAIYYELLFGMNESELDEYAKKKKVILVSPNTLHLTLQVIEHWFRDITIAKETKEIIKRLGIILLDGEKLSEGYQKLGKHIQNVQGAYEETGKRVELLSGRVKTVISFGDKIEETTPDLPQLP